MTPNLIRRSALVAFAATSFVATFAGCSNSDTNQADITTVDIELGNYTISPSIITIDAGTTNLHVTNTDSIVHNLTVAGRGTRNLAPGEQQTISVNVDAGTYNMWCDVAGHAQMGQTGTLQVIEAAAGAETAT